MDIPERNREFPPVSDGHEDFITEVRGQRYRGETTAAMAELGSGDEEVAT